MDVCGSGMHLTTLCSACCYATISLFVASMEIRYDLASCVRSDARERVRESKGKRDRERKKKKGNCKRKRERERQRQRAGWSLFCI